MSQMTEITSVVLRRCVATEEEWIDQHTINFLPGDSLKTAQRMDKEIPYWAKDNPISRVVRVRLIVGETIIAFP